MEIQSESTHLYFTGKVGGSLVGHKTFLELHSKTASQYSPKQAIRTLKNDTGHYEINSKL